MRHASFRAEPDMRTVGARRYDDMSPDIEHVAQGILSQHGVGRAAGTHRPCLEYDYAVAEHRGEIEVVQGDYAGEVQIADHAQDLDLVAYCEQVHFQSIARILWIKDIKSVLKEPSNTSKTIWVKEYAFAMWRLRAVFQSSIFIGSLAV